MLCVLNRKKITVLDELAGLWPRRGDPKSFYYLYKSTWRKTRKQYSICGILI